MVATPVEDELLNATMQEAFHRTSSLSRTIQDEDVDRRKMDVP